MYEFLLEHQIGQYFSQKATMLVRELGLTVNATTRPHMDSIFEHISQDLPHLQLVQPSFDQKMKNLGVSSV